MRIQSPEIVVRHRFRLFLQLETFVTGTKRDLPCGLIAFQEPQNCGNRYFTCTQIAMPAEFGLRSRWHLYDREALGGTELIVTNGKIRSDPSRALGTFPTFERTI